jgi:two-component system cell cycle sensor histidine kinase PleC
MLHAQTVVSAASVLPVLILTITVGGIALGLGLEILLWAIMSATLHSFLGYFAWRVVQKGPEAINPRRTGKYFLAAHAIAGLSWVYLATVNCNACSVEPFSIIQAVVLLIAIAATAIVASAMRGALLASFFLPVTTYALFSASYSNPVDVIMVVLLIGALPFFAYISTRLNRTAVMLISFKSEKDGLIAELETAKSMSDEARRRAEEANLAKSRFLASMSHELRTPLNAILGFSEVIADEVLGPVGNDSYKEYARDINTSGHHLLNLINEILDLSRIEAGRYELKEEAVNLAHIVEDCCHMIALKARTRDIRISQRFEEGMPRIWADERSVRQIALNLLSNAVKFTPVGGEIAVRVGWTAAGGQYIAVKDNGPGIPEEEIPIVLSAFGQGAIAIKNAEQGTGLGLPIVQALLAEHGGKLELRSKLREGTDAIAMLPASRVLSELHPIEKSA